MIWSLWLIIMEHSQTKILYYPKYTTGFTWATTAVELQAYLDSNYEETIEKKMDGSNLPFIIKTLDKRVGTYNSSTRTYTVTGANWTTNKFRWHQLIDRNSNKFVIASNTSDTITITPDSQFEMIKQPVSGEIEIKTPEYKNDDIIEVYGWKELTNTYSEPVDFSDKIIFIGQVAARKIRNDNRGITCNIKLSNMTELLLKTTRKWAINDTNFKTTPEKIDYIRQQVNGMNKGVINIIWAPTNPTTKINGDPFPEFTYLKDDAPAYDAMYDLSSIQYTGDVVDYYLYLKPVSEKTYHLFWQPKTELIDYTLTEGVDFDFIEFNNDKADIISSLIVVCGRDAKNSNIRQMVYGDFKHGSRTKRIASDITQALFDNEIRINRADFDLDAETNKYPTSFPYTTATSVTQDEVDSLVGSNYAGFINHTGTYSLSTATNFNKFIRYLSKARANIYGKLFLNRNNQTRDKLTVRFYATPASQIPGTSGKFIIPSIGWTGGGVGQEDYRKDLRLHSKKISMTNNGIAIDCNYIEDEKNLTLPTS
jgi:hypothetical protein